SPRSFLFRSREASLPRFGGCRFSMRPRQPSCRGAPSPAPAGEGWGGGGSKRPCSPHPSPRPPPAEREGTPSLARVKTSRGPLPPLQRGSVSRDRVRRGRPSAAHAEVAAAPPAPAADPAEARAVEHLNALVGVADRQHVAVADALLRNAEAGVRAAVEAADVGHVPAE